MQASRVLGSVQSHLKYLVTVLILHSIIKLFSILQRVPFNSFLKEILLGLLIETQTEQGYNVIFIQLKYLLSNSNKTTTPNLKFTFFR